MIFARKEFIPAIVEIDKVAREAFNVWAGKTPSLDPTPEPELTDNQLKAQEIVAKLNGLTVAPLFRFNFFKDNRRVKIYKTLRTPDDKFGTNLFLYEFFTDKDSFILERVDLVTDNDDDSQSVESFHFNTTTPEPAPEPGDDTALADREVEVQDEQPPLIKVTVGEEEVTFFKGEFHSVFSKKYHAAIVRTCNGILCYCLFNDDVTELCSVNEHEVSYDNFIAELDARQAKQFATQTPANLDDLAAADREVEVQDAIDALQDELLEAKAKASIALIDRDAPTAAFWEKKITEIQARMDKLQDEWIALTARCVEDEPDEPPKHTPFEVGKEYTLQAYDALSRPLTRKFKVIKRNKKSLVVAEFSDYRNKFFAHDDRYKIFNIGGDEFIKLFNFDDCLSYELHATADLIKEVI